MRIGGETVTYGDHVLVVGDAAGKLEIKQLVYICPSLPRDQRS